MSRKINNSIIKLHYATILKFLAIAAIITGLILTAKYFEWHEMLFSALIWIKEAGRLGILVFFLLYILWCVLILPGAILNIGGGLIFGVIQGTLVVSISATAGATAAFLVSRYLARSVVAQKIKGKKTFEALDNAVGDEGWKIVGLTRLSPFFPFNIFNYAFGVTRVTIRDYMLATLIGMIPKVLMYVYIGSLIGTVAELRIRESESLHANHELKLYILGLIITLGMSFFIMRISRRALKKRIEMTSSTGKNES